MDIKPSLLGDFCSQFCPLGANQASIQLIIMSSMPNIIFQDLPKVPSLATIHGSTMGLAFAIFMPLGAILIRFLRVKHIVLVHASCQLAGLALTIAGLGSGIRLAKIIGRVRSSPLQSTSQ